MIAETRTTPTRLIKSVVTDDRGRFVVPDLAGRRVRRVGARLRPGGLTEGESGAGKGRQPEGGRRARQEGRGTVLTPRSTGSRCCSCRRRAISPAPGDKGNGISPNIKSQGEWIRNIVNTDGCTGCHQMGGPATRTIPASILSQFEDTKMAWDRRIQSGQAGGGMSARFTQVGRARALGMYADWTDRIAKGELPSADARASAGHRAERRRHDVGLGGSEGLPARRDRERQAESDRQRERSDLRRARRERRLLPGDRSEDEHRER